MRLIVTLISAGLLLCGCGGGGGGGGSSVGPQPSPTISVLAPATATAGGAALTLTVNGTNFVSSSLVRWNGATLPTTYTSAAQLVAMVPASDIASAGTAQVTVLNPTSEGGASAAAAFTIAAAQGNAPQISSLAPASAAAGGAAMTLAVNGSNFVSSSVVHWNGASLPTTYVSAARLTAQVPASDIASAGTAAITVLNPESDGGESAAVSFTIAGAQGSGPQLVQFNVYQTSGSATEGNSTLQFDALTKAGDTIWVAVTVSDYAGAHSISVADTQGNSYTLLDQENDAAPGSQTVAHFYAASIAGDAATPDTVTINWTEDDYKGILIAEIAGTTQTIAVGHIGNIQDALGVAANAVTSGPINVSAAETPALLVALSMDTTGGSSDTGGSGSAGPTAGSGMSPVTTLWDYGANLATFETANVTGAESISATFTPLHTDSYVTVAAVFH